MSKVQGKRDKFLFLGRRASGGELGSSRPKCWDPLGRLGLGEHAGEVKPGRRGHPPSGCHESWGWAPMTMPDSVPCFYHQNGRPRRCADRRSHQQGCRDSAAKQTPPAQPERLKYRSRGHSAVSFWVGDWSDAEDFFEPLHVTHLNDWCPSIMPYLLLPPGWRILIADGYEDVWEDPSLLRTEGPK